MATMLEVQPLGTTWVADIIVCHIPRDWLQTKNTRCAKETRKLLKSLIECPNTKLNPQVHKKLS